MKKVSTILIVDDEADFLSSMRRVLRKEPYHVRFAQNGPAAIEIVENEDVDLVVTDYVMPDMNGLELIENLRQRHPHIIAIMLTAVSEIDIAIKAVNDVGIFKFFLKPVQTNTLKGVLRRTVELLESAPAERSVFQAFRSRDAILADLEREYPGITSVRRDADGCCIME